MKSPGLDLLILGGTAWLGQRIAQAAVAAGHRVACLARGVAGPAPSGVEFVQADRSQPYAYAAVSARSWHAVIDLARQPGQARAAAQALRGSCQHALVVSSISVYASHAAVGQDESAATLAPFQGDEFTAPTDYGAAKLACEHAYLKAFGAQRCLIARPGLIAGPGDATDRTGYWPWRFARAASAGQAAVLIPKAENQWTQMLDARDLALWLLRSAENSVSAVVNAVGQAVPLSQFLNLAREIAGHTGPLATAPADWLMERGVKPWAGDGSLPLWVAMDSHAGFARYDGGLATRLGLTRRTLQETIADVLVWEAQRPPSTEARKAGLTDAQQANLLGLLSV